MRCDRGSGGDSLRNIYFWRMKWSGEHSASEKRVYAQIPMVDLLYFLIPAEIPSSISPTVNETPTINVASSNTIIN